jgi:hypothetical protein
MCVAPGSTDHSFRRFDRILIFPLSDPGALLSCPPVPVSRYRREPIGVMILSDGIGRWLGDDLDEVDSFWCEGLGASGNAASGRLAD